MEQGGSELHVTKGQVSEDLYTQLAERERDLELAAELGKALLEQNEELKKKFDQSVEEYNSKLEVGIRIMKKKYFNVGAFVFLTKIFQLFLIYITVDNMSSICLHLCMILLCNIKYLDNNTKYNLL